jgi:hypothetical protein
MTDFNPTNPNPLGNNGIGKVGQQAGKNQQPQTPAEQPKANPPQPKNPEMSEQVRAQLMWLSKQGEENVKLARIDRWMKTLPAQNKHNKLFKKVNDTFVEEFGFEPTEEFTEQVVSNLFTGLPVVAGNTEDEAK